jgi:hypothetical protein
MHVRAVSGSLLTRLLLCRAPRDICCMVSPSVRVTPVRPATMPTSSHQVCSPWPVMRSQATSRSLLTWLLLWRVCSVVLVMSAVCPVRASVRPRCAPAHFRPRCHRSRSSAGGWPCACGGSTLPLAYAGLLGLMQPEPGLSGAPMWHIWVGVHLGPHRAWPG